MGENLGAKAVSRRSALSFLGLAAASFTILSSVLTTSDAEAQTVGMVRRHNRRVTRRVARRAGRYTRRAVRRYY